jgi:hypothetical protein
VRTITSKYCGLSIHGRHLVYSDLCGDDVASALNIKIRSPAPVLDLCRALVAAGVDPATELHCYRGETLCLRIRAIGEAGKLKIGGDGVTFRPRSEPVSAPSTRSRHRAGRRIAA